MQEKIKLLTENIIIELAPKDEIWDGKKILSILKKPKGEERLAFWRENLQIDMQMLPGNTPLQKEKNLIEEIDKALLSCLDTLVEQKKVCMFYDINAKSQKIKKYTLAFPMESYERNTEQFLKKLEEQKKQYLAQLAEENAKAAQEQEKQKQEIREEREKITREYERQKQEKEAQAAKEKQEKEAERQRIKQEKEAEKQRIKSEKDAEIEREKQEKKAQEERDAAQKEQETKERMELLQKFEASVQTQLQAIKEYVQTLERNKSLTESSLKDSQEFLKQIHTFFPKPEKKAKSSAPQMSKGKKTKKETPLPEKTAKEKAIQEKPVQKVFFYEQQENNHETSLDEACESIHKLYSKLRVIQSYPVIKIHQLRRELNFSREMFDQAIETLARQKKVDLLQSSDEEFEADERRDAYYDAIEDRVYYFIQWR